MANTASARKRARQALKRRARNVALRSTARSAIRRVRRALAAGDRAAALAAFERARSTLDRVAAKGVIHPNAAARHKSRLARAIKALGA